MKKRHAVRLDQLDSDLEKILKTVCVTTACGFIGCLLSVPFLLFWYAQIYEKCPGSQMGGLKPPFFFADNSTDHQSSCIAVNTRYLYQFPYSKWKLKFSLPNLLAPATGSIFLFSFLSNFSFFFLYLIFCLGYPTEYIHHQSRKKTG